MGLLWRTRVPPGPKPSTLTSAQFNSSIVTKGRPLRDHWRLARQMTNQMRRKVGTLTKLFEIFLDNRMDETLDLTDTNIPIKPRSNGIFLKIGRPLLICGTHGNGIFPASIDPRKNISAFVASMEKSRLSEIKFIAGAR